MAALQMDTPATALRNAAYAGDLGQVKGLILEGVDVNVADQHRRTALLHACERGHIEVVTVLLAAGAWPDMYEDYDTFDTPLMVAAIHGHLEIVKKLIVAGADSSFHVGFSQRTAESHARSYGQMEVADFLASLRSR